MTIIDALKLHKNFPRFDGELGLEIETETKRKYEVPLFTYWSTHTDGSLRDFGIEYVLKQPVKFEKELDLALQEFSDKTKGIKFIPDSISTSVHVHMNILNESFKTLGNLLTLYTIYENLLIRFSGPDRISNLFCLPICDAEITYQNIVTMFKGIANKNYKSMSFSENHVKYSALNLSSIFQYGSVEVRSFRGTTDIKLIKDWISILYCLMKYARKNISPRDIMNSFKENPEKLMENVFGEYRKNLKIPDENRLVEKNIFYAGSIAFSVKNWDMLDASSNTPKFVLKPKDLEIYAKQIFGKLPSTLTPAELDYINIHAERDYLNSRQWNTTSNAIDEAMLRVMEDRPVLRRRRADEILAEANREGDV